MREITDEYRKELLAKAMADAGCGSENKCVETEKESPPEKEAPAGQAGAKKSSSLDNNNILRNKQKVNLKPKASSFNKFKFPNDNQGQLDTIRHFPGDEVCEFIYNQYDINLKVNVRSTSPLRPESDNETVFQFYEDGRWYDYATQEGGDLIDFVMKLEDCEFPEALSIISDYFKLQPGSSTGRIKPKKTKKKEYVVNSEKKTAFLEELEYATKFVHQNLKNNQPDHMEYLKRRGLTEDFITQKQIGCLDDIEKLNSWLHENYPEFEPTDLNLNCLLDSIFIPYFDKDGTVIYAVGHFLPGSGKPKYVKLRCQQAEDVRLENPIFGLDTLNRCRETGYVILGEGIFDILVLDQEGVSVLGSAGGAFSKKQKADIIQHIKDLQQENPDLQILIWFDFDPESQTGQKAAMAMGQFLIQNGIIASICLFEGCEKIDINDLYVNGGAEAVYKAINQAESYLSVKAKEVILEGDNKKQVTILEALIDDMATGEFPIEVMDQYLKNLLPEELVDIGLQKRESPSDDFDSFSEVVLPGEHSTFSKFGGAIGSIAAAQDEVTHRYYKRGNNVVTIEQQMNGWCVKQLTPERAQSSLEKIVKFVSSSKAGEFKPAVCSLQNAKTLLQSDSFLQYLLPISLVTNSPVPVLRSNGKFDMITGYDSETGILAHGDIKDVPLDKGINLINEIICDYSFQTPSDKSRAVGALLTPMLIFSGILDRAPMFMVEADQSQTGKGFLIKLISSVYGEKPAVITMKNRGRVGSIDEDFDAAVINCNPFISLDNLKGKLDSSSIESFMTEDVYSARIPYSPPTMIETGKTVLSATSNGVELTKDQANRCCIIRTKKQRNGYPYQTFPEGDILDHIRTNQPLFLGAVFSILKHYINQEGALLHKTTNESRHSFRRWAGTVDYIIQKIFGLPPLMDNHSKEQERMANPAFQWLREICLAVVNAGKEGHSLKAHDLAELAYAGGVGIPGLAENRDFGVCTDHERSQVWSQIGRRMSMGFQDKDELVVDNFTITRREVKTRDHKHMVKEYQILSNKSDDSPDSTVDVPQAVPSMPSPTSPDALEEVQHIISDDVSIDTVPRDIPNNIPSHIYVRTPSKASGEPAEPKESISNKLSTPNMFE